MLETVRFGTCSFVCENLSERGADVFFYLIYGNTGKETACKLGISFRTIECHIDTLKQKFQCDRKSALIEKAINLGYLNFLPSNLINQ